MRSVTWLFACIVLTIGLAFFRTRRKRAKLARMTWNALIAQLRPVPMEQITMIALDYLHPCKGQLDFNIDEVWSMVGGAEGVRRMYENAGVLIALASYAQHWNPLESIVVVERMRRDGVTLRRAARQLLMNSRSEAGLIAARFSVQEAASSYYLMRARVLALYENSQAGRLPDLRAVV